jgi:hypothetical protein
MSDARDEDRAELIRIEQDVAAKRPRFSKCPSCGTAWHYHLGMEGTCEQLVKAKAEIVRLGEINQNIREVIATFCRRVQGSGLPAAQSLCDTIRLCLDEKEPPPPRPS